MKRTRCASRSSALGAAIGAVMALWVIGYAPGAAAGAVPSAQWYWSLVAPGPSALLLGTSNGVYRSSDGGKTWRAAGLTGVNATSLVEAGATIYAGGVRGKAGSSTSPVSNVNGAPVVSAGESVLEASSNGGTSWRELHPKGLPSLGLSALAVDPANSAILYAVLRDGAVYRSTDAASSFALVSSKIGGAPWALAVAQNGQLIGGDMRTGAYLSTNGKQWQHARFVDPEGTRMVMEYAVDPTDAKRVLMTSWGIVASTDNGASWHVSLKSKVMFGPIAWAAGSSSVVYAVGFDGSLWHSTDGGGSWSEVA